jgi:hypothetical protein
MTLSNATRNHRGNCDPTLATVKLHSFFNDVFVSVIHVRTFIWSMLGSRHHAIYYNTVFRSTQNQRGD